MASKTEYELSEPRKALIESDEVLDEMKQNGQLIPFTDYYTPDEDEGSGQLVAEYTVSSNTTSVTISGLDINADGGVYDLIITGNASASVNMQAFVSGQTSQSGTGFFISSGSLTPQNVFNYMWAGYWDNNGVFGNITITCIDGKVAMFSTVISGNVITYSKGNCSTSNITSITLSGANTSSITINAGTKIKIYKRATNSPTRS